MPSLLGLNIKFLRKQRGDNQAKVALVVDKGDTTIGNWEKGISEPNLKELQALSQYFGVSIDDLLSTDLTCTANPHIKTHEKQPKSTAKSTGNSTANTVNEAGSQYSRGSPKDLSNDVETLKLTIQNLKEMISAKDEIIKTKDELINAHKATIDGLSRELEAAGITISSAKRSA